MREYIERSAVLQVIRDWRKQYHPEIRDGGILAACVQALPAYILTEERNEPAFVSTEG